MKDNRRDFLRKTALGTVAISSGMGFSVLNAQGTGNVPESDEKIGEGTAEGSQSFPGWEVTFDESASTLLLKNGQVSLKGQLTFHSDANKWVCAKSRDGVKERFAITDSQGNVQGYFVFHKNCEKLQLLFYHRTAQSYKGVLSFEGSITFFENSFSCRTRPEPGERVLSLACGQVDSLLNDSLFAPESDTALRLDAARLHLESANPGSYLVAMSGQINESSEAVFSFNLDNFFLKNRYVPYYHALNPNRCPKTPTGWMSWNVYFDKATADDNLAEAKVGKKYLQPFGCEFWSIESWQENSDQLPVRNFHNMNLEVSKNKFPKGMKRLAEDIRKLGFRPGLWTAPFGTGNKDFYNEHKDWFLHDKNGSPIQTWNGLYTVDPTVPEAREHLKKIHDIASHEWGYEFFKIDGMSGRSHSYCAHFYERPEIRARFRDPSCPNPFELCVKAFREGMGEDRVFLACQGHTSGPEALYADASRIGADIVHPNMPVEWSGVVNQGRCFVSQAFTHNIVMIADPDTLLVRALPLEEARVSTTIVALPGQLTFFGDKLADMPEERMKMLQQTLPVAQVRPMNLYPYFSMLPVWNLKIKNSLLGDYNVVALFNWEDESKAISYTTDELGIDPDTTYSLYEFWTQTGLNSIKGSFSLEVPPHSVRLIAMHKEKSVPQWISSDRHVAQNAIELKEYGWKAESRTLEGRIELIGTFPLTMRVKVPEDFVLSGAECSGAGCMTKQEANGILAVTLKSEKTGEYLFKIKF